MKSSFNIKIGGEAGEGIRSVGLTLSKCFVRTGFHTFDYTEYPSLIRGGHNTYQAHISCQPVYSQIQKVDLLIALDKKTVDIHQKELTKDSLVIYDPGEFKLSPQDTSEVSENLVGIYLPIPLIELATSSGGKPVMANNVALGAVMNFAELDLAILKGIIAEVFAKKGEEIITQNHQAAQDGFDYASEKLSSYKLNITKPKSLEKKILLTGNEAIGLGAISAGMRFFAAYPMTPVTSILHYLAAKAKEHDLVVKHAEDEISVINMALGASFAGVRSMVATSGGGFSLMCEALGMAGMMELPLVLVEGMRSGPSTGMPTWHDQADLRFVLHASQGEFPRMVLAPGDVQECFSFTRQAFYFAEKYQTPVIILTDKFLAESPASMEKPQAVWNNSRFSLVFSQERAKETPRERTSSEVARPARQRLCRKALAGGSDSSDGGERGVSFKRYLSTDNGISLRSIPGQKDGVHLANSYEHDEFGFATEEIEERNKMVEKRLRKFESLSKEALQIKQQVFGQLPAKIGLVSWGSNKGPILQALKNFKGEVAFLHLNVLWPFPKSQVEDFLSKVKIVVDVECNATGQLASLIREQTGFEIKEKLLKYDGRPFYPEEINENLRTRI